MSICITCTGFSFGTCCRESSVLFYTLNRLGDDARQQLISSASAAMSGNENATGHSDSWYKESQLPPSIDPLDGRSTVNRLEVRAALDMSVNIFSILVVYTFQFLELYLSTEKIKFRSKGESYWLIFQLCRLLGIISMQQMRMHNYLIFLLI